MANPIKQTLFTFRTLRAPEKASSYARNNYFIKHYNGTSGAFFEAVSGMGPDDITKEVMSLTAENYVNKKTRDEIISIDANLYAFGLLILKNRKTITHAEVNTAISGLSTVSNINRKYLWNNLFYQTVTLESGATRESILVMLVANHLVDNFASIPTNDTDMQKWANSRIVLPKILFGNETELSEIITHNNLANGLGELNRGLNKTELSLELETLNIAKDELLTYKGGFLKTNDVLQSAAIEAHEIATELALINGTHEEVTDPNTGLIYTNIKDVVFPVFAYVRPNEIDSIAFQLNLSKQTNYVFNKYGLLKAKNFIDLEEKLNKLIHKYVSELFDNTTFYTEQIEIDGSLISKCTISNKFNKENSYATKLVKRGTNDYGVIIAILKPIDPRLNNYGSLNAIPNATYINENNYLQWAAVYGVDVAAPKQKYISISKNINKPADGPELYEVAVVKDEVAIPAGYGVSTIHVGFEGLALASFSKIIFACAGRRMSLSGTNAWWSNQYFTSTATQYELGGMTGTIPISAQFTAYKGGIGSVIFYLERREGVYEDWQLETFNAIIAGYEDKFADYRNYLAELAAKKGVAIGENPAFHRRIENTVLKKNCMAYLTGFNYLGQDYTTGSETETQQVNVIENMDKYSAAVKFFEQAFEWELMDYQFYPFYWANKKRWTELYSVDNDDALFRNFLQSGMARTIVTVRPGFEAAVMYYMQTGLIWNGGEVPVFEDVLYQDILDDLLEPEYTLEDTWETRVPSSLTVIQASTIALDADGLPCYCDDIGVPPEETIFEPIVNPLTNLDVHIDGEIPTP